MAFTELLDTLGGVGRFQMLYTALLLFPCSLLACHNFLQNFTAAVPQHHCLGHTNGTGGTNLTVENWWRASIPIDQHQRPEPCLRFVQPQWALLDPNATVSGVATEGCEDGWTYDQSIFPSTIVTEWDLVCDSRPMRDLAQTIYMAGVLVGAAVFGSVADRWGRKAPLIWSYLQLAVSGACTAYFSSFTIYCVFRFLTGMTFSGIILNSLSLVVEWMPTQGRTVAGALLGYAFTLGQILLAGVAYLVRPWRWLQFAVSAPFLVIFLYSWWLPESSRWLLLHGKSHLAIQNLRKVATLNGKREEGQRLTKEVVSAYMQSESSVGRPSSSVLDLFRTPAIRKVTCCLMVVWFSNSLAYYGLAMDLQKFGLSIYLVQVMFGVIDIPAMLVSTTTMIYVGRRATVASFLILAGFMVIANMFVPQDMQTLRTAQAALGKGCLASSFISVYLFAGELYPTQVRQMGMGFVSVNARLGGMAAPLVSMLAEYHSALPPVIFGATAILAGVAVCFLMETRNMPLVETIEAMERRAKGCLSKEDTKEKSEEVSLQPTGISSHIKETI
ncbi:solute carrier family 22 member 20-like [Dromiciops gliroides]|uniref:solute carrier family 22 member 20-like n=1 Tax=Dromiciops gliroides TaxID=33562 RepID=UPI001CC48C46|nr:solute carrier family 22 member 20-like [Dromiciops gliroides]